MKQPDGDETASEDVVDQLCGVAVRARGTLEGRNIRGDLQGSGLVFVEGLGQGRHQVESGTVAFVQDDFTARQQHIVAGQDACSGIHLHGFTAVVGMAKGQGGGEGLGREPVERHDPKQHGLLSLHGVLLL